MLVLTGAGVSAASGMPTFRGEEGLWKDRRPEELATPSAFRRDPRLVWEWYAWRRQTAADCEPNAAHLALARWSLARPDAWIATQNVDGLHGEALRQVAERGAGAPQAGPGGATPDPGDEGADAEDALDTGAAPAARDRLLELHGSLFRVRCTGCDRRAMHREPVDADSREALPRCGDCGDLLRPDVVWFGESLEAGVLGAAREAAVSADVCLVVGTSAVVQPAASLASVAARSGGALVEVNPEATPLSGRADVTIRAGAAAAVPRLLDG